MSDIRLMRFPAPARRSQNKGIRSELVFALVKFANELPRPVKFGDEFAASVRAVDLRDVMDRSIRNNSYSTNGGPRPNHHMSSYNGKNRPSGGYGSHGSRVSPTSEAPSNNNNGCHQEELVNYIYESWDKVSREIERSNDVKYFQSTNQFPNFVPFDLEVLWGRRTAQNIKRPQHNS